MLFAWKIYGLANEINLIYIFFILSIRYWLDGEGVFLYKEVDRIIIVNLS